MLHVGIFITIWQVEGHTWSDVCVCGGGLKNPHDENLTPNTFEILKKHVTSSSFVWLMAIINF